MEFDFYEWRKFENIRPIVLDNKEQYIIDIMNIEHSWSGRVDSTVNANVFIMEAVQLLINAISMFEQGYFDCAYYSLRESVEVSTTMIYLVDMPEEEKSDLFRAWNNTQRFPMQAQMLRQLVENGSIFADMRDKMPDFFEDTKEYSKKLNKYVHKQGFQHFYIIRNHPIHVNDPTESFVNSFEEHLKKCIGIVAVMRLAVDPFPVLLMDEEILYRCFDSMTDPYSEEFVSKYIKTNVLDEYKTTNIYCDTYESFVDKEKKNNAVFDVMKHQYIDSSEKKQLLSQLHLLNETDAVCTIIVLSCNKIVKTYALGGLLMFFTNRKTNRSLHNWKGSDFKEFEEEKVVNHKYDEAYISTIEFHGDCYFMEHNELLSQGDYADIQSALAVFNPYHQE